MSATSIEKQDMWLSPSVVLTVGAVMTFVSLLYSPETKQLQLDEVGEEHSVLPLVQRQEPAVAMD